jgi:hypothetical protein
VLARDSCSRHSNPQNNPRALILSALSRQRTLPPPTGTGLLDEGQGIIYGMYAQSVDDTKGLWQFSVKVAKIPYGQYITAFAKVDLWGTPNEQDLQLVLKVTTKVEEMGAFVQAAREMWGNVAQRNWDTLIALASGDLDRPSKQSENCRWLGVYMVETMVAINNWYASKSPFERGEIEGRVTLEAVMILLPFLTGGEAEATQLSKAEFLTRLSDVDWIKNDAELSGVVKEVLKMAKGEVSPRVAAEILEVEGAKEGRVGVRIWSRAVAKMSQANPVPRRRAFLEAMVEVIGNAEDRQVAARMRDLQDILLSELPDTPSSQDMEKVYTIDDWRYLTRLKGVLLSGDECEIVIPGKGVLRGHHIIERVMVEDHLNARFGFSLSEGDITVKILTQTEHAGAGMDSLHNKMWFQWKPNEAGIGVLHHSRLGEFNTAQDMMNELIDFYLANYPDLAKATRGCCLKNGIPFSH